jgi:hypothetical protein
MRDFLLPTMASNVEYRFKPSPEEWPEEKQARLRERFGEVKDEVSTQYEELVCNGLIDKEAALEMCLHDILSKLALEFGVALLTLRYSRCRNRDDGYAWSEDSHTLKIQY